MMAAVPTLIALEQAAIDQLMLMAIAAQGSLEVNQKPVARMVLASPEAPVSP